MFCTVYSLGLQQSYLQLLSYFAELKSRMRMRWPCVQVECREGSRGVRATNETCFMLFTQAPLMSAVFAPSGRRQSDTLALASLSSVGLTQVILSLNSLGYNPNTLHSAQCNSSIINTESASILLFLLQPGTRFAVSDGSEGLLTVRGRGHLRGHRWDIGRTLLPRCTM